MAAAATTTTTIITTTTTTAATAAAAVRKTKEKLVSKIQLTKIYRHGGVPNNRSSYSSCSYIGKCRTLFLKANNISLDCNLVCLRVSYSLSMHQF